MLPHLKQGALKDWKDVFPLAWDKKMKRSKMAKIRPMTEQEKQEFDFIIKNSINLN